MQYLVRARPTPRELPTFWKLLNSGTISRQEPDGREIVASMKRAVVNGDTVEWYETCFCSPPLKNERTTVYDQFFTDMKVEPLRESLQLQGEPFWDYLREYSTNQEYIGTQATSSSQLRYVPIRVV